MSSGPRPRRPGKVVIMVIAFWVVGNILQSIVGWLLGSSGLFDANTAFYVGLVLGWGLLFLISLYYRDYLDYWLRS
jgi:hypothetical protein